MKTVNRVAIDSSGNFVDLFTGVEKNGDFIPLYYNEYPKNGISFLDIPVPTNQLKPKWTGKKWEETATPEEIDEWEQNKPVQKEKNEISRIAQVELALMELAEIMGEL